MTKGEYIEQHKLAPVIEEITNIAKEVCGAGIWSRTFLRNDYGAGTDLIVEIKVPGKHDPAKHTEFALKTAHLADHQDVLRWFLQFTKTK